MRWYCDVWVIFCIYLRADMMMMTISRQIANTRARGRTNESCFVFCAQHVTSSISRWFFFSVGTILSAVVRFMDARCFNMQLCWCLQTGSPYSQYVNIVYDGIQMSVVEVELGGRERYRKFRDLDKRKWCLVAPVKWYLIYHMSNAHNTQIRDRRSTRAYRSRITELVKIWHNTQTPFNVHSHSVWRSAHE